MSEVTLQEAGALQQPPLSTPLLNMEFSSDIPYPTLPYLPQPTLPTLTYPTLPFPTLPLCIWDQGLGFMVYGFKFRVEVQGVEWRVRGLGVMIQGLGVRVYSACIPRERTPRLLLSQLLQSPARVEGSLGFALSDFYSLGFALSDSCFMLHVLKCEDES